MRTNKFEIAQNFVIHNYSKLLSGEKMPPVKFIFNDDGYALFEKLREFPIPDELGVVIGRIYQYQIDVMKDESMRINDEIVIYIPDALEFFSRLSIIANLYQKISRYNSPNKLAKEFFSSALWLRMTPQDCNNIYGFLDRQIGFLYNICYLDNIGEIEYDKYIIRGLNEVNDDFYESFNRMCFTVYDDEESKYELPSIHYGIVDENYSKVCYIYGIQNMFLNNQNKKIARSLYKLNKGIEDPNIHPSFVLAMKTFIEVLVKKGITEIKVPLLEVLNYGYHESFSQEYKKVFENEWKDESIIDENDVYQVSHYTVDKRIYDNYVDKEDNISKSKTEVFASVFYRLQEQFDNIDIDVNDFELIIKPKKNKMLVR